MANKKTPEQIRKYYLSYHKNNPWLKYYVYARCRCLKKYNDSYPNYGGKGIKFLMTTSDFKFLWKRDKAHLLKQPSIDRINSDGNYVLANCRFIELKLNRYLGQMGSKHPRAKLKESDILKIRKMSKNQSHRSIAKIFGVDSTNIDAIMRGQTWRHVL